jgi:mycofactocin system glycosyltransferase
MSAVRLDQTYRRHQMAIVAGSPLRIITLTAAGTAAAANLETAAATGQPAAPSSLLERLIEIGGLHPIPDPDAVTQGRSRFGLEDVTVVRPIYRSAAGGRPIDSDPRVANCIIVDDGSTPPIIEAQIRLDHNRGPAAARAAGLAEVNTALVAFVDDDVDPSRGWLEGVLGHFDDERVALVAPRVLSADGPSRLERYERRHSPLDLGEHPARIAPATAVSYVPAAAIVCRVDALQAIGGFDEALRVGEDVDLVWRLVEAGWRCRYEPTVTVTHRPRPTWQAWARQRVAYGSSSALLAERGHDLAPVRTSAWTALVWALALTGRWRLALAIVAALSIALIRRLPMLPPTESIRLVGLGTWHTGRMSAMAVRRAWWPLLAVAALVSRRARLILLASAIAAGAPLRVADDVAFSLGLWSGIVKRWREVDRPSLMVLLAPLLPRFTAWPSRGD